MWTGSDARVVAYMDVDLSTDLAALLPLVAPLLSGHSDVAIGSRLSRSARVVRGPKREVISRCYNMILRTTLRTRFSDAQCGFKAMRTECARALLPHVATRRGSSTPNCSYSPSGPACASPRCPSTGSTTPTAGSTSLSTAVADLRGVARVGRALVRRDVPLRDIGAQLGRGGAPESLFRQAIRFGVIGVLSTVAYLLLFLMFRAPLGAQAANFTALLLTAIANTAVNRRFTFGVRGRRRAGDTRLRACWCSSSAWPSPAARSPLLGALSAAPRPLDRARRPRRRPTSPPPSCDSSLFREWVFTRKVTS